MEFSDTTTIYAQGTYWGYQTLVNNMSYLGVLSGTKEGYSIFYIIYWDGEALRGYIPEKGNLWDPQTGKVYDIEPGRQRTLDADELLEDILARISAR